MTVITIDSTKFMESLGRVAFFFVVWGFSYICIIIGLDIWKSSNKRERLQEAKQLYTARKRQHENNLEGWKKWRDVNYKITDLVESSTYY